MNGSSIISLEKEAAKRFQSVPDPVFVLENLCGAGEGKRGLFSSTWLRSPGALALEGGVVALAAVLGWYTSGLLRS